MRYFKVDLGAEGERLVYPAFHRDDFPIGGYLVENGRNICLVGAEDDWVAADDYVKDKAVTELSKAEAIALSEAVQERKEVVTNPAVVQRLQIKAQLGDAFTADELKAMDPDDASADGFGREKILADVINERDKSV